MINNGNIVFNMVTGGGRDNNGNPIASTHSYINAPCNIKVVKNQIVYNQDQQYKDVQYEVNIDKSVLPSTFDYTKCSKVNLRYVTVIIGDFRPSFIEKPMFNQLKIMCRTWV